MRKSNCLCFHRSYIFLPAVFTFHNYHIFMTNFRSFKIPSQFLGKQQLSAPEVFFSVREGTSLSWRPLKEKTF